jgi:hypothetical protein
MKVELARLADQRKTLLKIESRERFHRSDFSEPPNEVYLGIGKSSEVQRTLLSMYANQRPRRETLRNRERHEGPSRKTHTSLLH